MKVKIYNQTGQETQESVELSDKIFSIEKVKPELVHFVANALLSNRRNPVASTKTRGEVRGGGKKPWKQKGTGRARHGSIRSPLWRGGGVTFGPRSNRNFVIKVNKKVRRLGIFSVLTDRAREGKVSVLDKFILEQGKTKELLAILKAWGEGKSEKLLIVVSKKETNLLRASKNLHNVRVALANNFNLLELLWADRLLILKDALPVIEKTYLRTQV